VVIGALHAYFIWFGDILFMYGLIGMLAFLFRNRMPRTQLLIACCLLPMAVLFGIGFSAQLQTMQEKVAEIEAQPFAAPDEEEMQRDIAIHLGSYREITAQRIPKAMQYQFFGLLFFGLWRVLALMLIGMALIKTGVLSAARTAPFYRTMMVVCYSLGLPLTAYSALDLHAHGFNPIYAMGMGSIANYFGSVVVALGHIALVMLLVSTGFVQKLLQRFAAVGQMAVSNYLMHSIVLTTIFYGYGFGLYGSIPRFAQMGFVVLVIGAQLLLSPWWLARYRFGPAEWLWRSLTYGRWQPWGRA